MLFFHFSDNRALYLEVMPSALSQNKFFLIIVLWGWWVFNSYITGNKNKSVIYYLFSVSKLHSEHWKESFQNKLTEHFVWALHPITSKVCHILLHYDTSNRIIILIAAHLSKLYKHIDLKYGLRGSRSVFINPSFDYGQKLRILILLKSAYSFHSFKIS